MTTIAAALAAAVTLVYASLFEWLVHRFGYHEEGVWPAAGRDHVLHHDVYYPPERFLERGPLYRDSHPWWIEAVYVALHLPAIAALALASASAAAASFVVLVVYALLVHYVHPLSHRRTGLFYERTRLWKRIMARHVRHHREQSVNFNFVLPLGDWLFGTLAPTPRKLLRNR